MEKSYEETWPDGMPPEGCDEKGLVKLSARAVREALSHGYQSADADECASRAVLYRLQRARQVSLAGEALGHCALEDARAVRDALRYVLRELMSRRRNVPLDDESPESITVFGALAAPEAALEAADKAAAIHAAFESLAPAQQALLISHHVDGVTLGLIAEGLGCTEEAVKQQLARARARLHRVLRNVGIVVGSQ